MLGRPLLPRAVSFVSGVSKDIPDTHHPHPTLPSALVRTGSDLHIVIRTMGVIRLCLSGNGRRQTGKSHLYNGSSPCTWEGDWILGGRGMEQGGWKCSCLVRLGRLLTVWRTLGSGGEEGLKSILSSTQQVRRPKGNCICLEKARSSLICKRASDSMLLGPGPRPLLRPQKLLLNYC